MLRDKAAWIAWFDGMGDHLVDQGKPAVARTTRGNCSPDTTELGGYSVIQADDLEVAAAVAKGCRTCPGRAGWKSVSSEKFPARVSPAE